MARLRVYVTAPPREDGALSIVESWADGCVMSTGEEFLLDADGSAELCRQLCQERAAVVIARMWPTTKGNRLVAVLRIGTVPQKKELANGKVEQPF